jgi:hypothetical protein
MEAWENNKTLVYLIQEINMLRGTFGWEGKKE